MRATLIYNENSGGARQTSADKLLSLLEAQGFEPVYQATSSEEELDPILDKIDGLVVSVGGDGTHRAVVTRMINKGASLAMIPCGTANNIARSLDISGSPEELIQALENPIHCKFDVGHVISPFGEDYFLEAIGCGLFADILYDYNPEKGKSVLRALKTINDVLLGYDPKHLEVRLDGESLEGHYIGLEVLNTKATGPRLKLAPNADPCDGTLDVVCVSPPKNVSLFDYIAAILSDGFDKLENVTVLKGKTLELAWDGEPFHLDDELRPQPDKPDSSQAPALGARPDSQTKTAGKITVEILPAAIDLWLPQKDAA